MIKARLISGTGLALAVVLLLVVNIFSNASFTTARLDFTEDGLYTLSDGTLNIISGLDEPVTLRFYLSRTLANQLPGISGYANRVEELLREYEIRSQGNLRLLVLEPEPFSEEEDRAVGYGIRGLAFADADETFYFGLVGTNSVGEQQVIPYFNQAREQFLEYDITRLLHQLSQIERPVIGLLSTIPIRGVNAEKIQTGAAAQSLTLVEQMRELFEVRNLPTDVTQIPDEVDVLMLVHPRELSESTLYALDQFVMRAGRVLVFVDPYAEADARQTASGIPEVTASDFNRLLTSWGAELEADTVVTDLQFATRVQTQKEGKVVVFDYPVWITYPAELLNPFDTVTSDLDNLTFASVGNLMLLGSAGVEVETLVKSTLQADRVTTEQISFTADPEELLRNYAGENQQLPLAIRITGTPSSAFPDGRPATAQAGGSNKDDASGDESAPAPHLASAQSPVNLIVVADTDLLQDRYWVQTQDFLGSRISLPFAGNGSFVVNALDNLSGSNDLINVRSRGTFSRPFDLVSQLRRDAEIKYRQKEQELITRLDETEKELLALENQKQGGEALILSEAQQRKVQEFRQQRAQIRKQLRDVRHDLRKDIEALEGWLKFVNIGLIPLLIGIGGLLAAVFRRRRRKASMSVQTDLQTTRAPA